LSTSKTFNFQSPQVEQIIREAYERVFGNPVDAASSIVQERIEAAQRSLNFILSQWPNEGLNLWTVRAAMLALYPNQGTYLLPPATSDVLEVHVRTSNRNLGGTPFASSGVAQNAFDNNTQTACVQTGANGNIGYGWGQSQYAIEMVGIQSGATLTYTLVFEYSLDGINWFIAGMPDAQEYGQGLISWFIVDIPTLANYFRIRETGGATLNIEEAYFNTSTNDRKLTRVSRADYMAYPNKNQSGAPSSFYVARVINPTITLWTVPNSQYNCLFFTYIEMPEDIGAMTDSPPVPSRFLEALASALAYKLALKEKNLEVLDALRADAEKAFKSAYIEDRERVPLTIYGNSQGWGRV
jgi:hypothetical protein